MSDATPNPAIQNEAKDETTAEMLKRHDAEMTALAKRMGVPAAADSPVVEHIPAASPEVVMEVARIEAWDKLQKAFPKGMGINSMPFPVAPGKTEQAYMKSTVQGVIRGATIDGGCVIDAFFLGGRRIVPNEKGEFPVLDHHTNPGDYLIAIAKNPSTGQDVRVGTVTWWVESGAAPAQAAGGQPQAPVYMPPGAVQGGGQSGGQVQYSPQPSGQGALPSGPVTPGRNEVAVLLAYGDAVMLLQAIQSNTPVYAAMAPPFIRAFEQALGRMPR